MRQARAKAHHTRDTSTGRGKVGEGDSGGSSNPRNSDRRAAAVAVKAATVERPARVGESTG